MTQHSPEFSHVPEYETEPASIRLEFFRHDEKGKSAASGDRTGDEFVRLTDQGRAHATEVGKQKDPHPETAIVFGSERERSVETSMRQMLANVDTITPQTSLEELRALVDSELTVGRKDKAISELNFDWETNLLHTPANLNQKTPLHFCITTATIKSANLKIPPRLHIPVLLVDLPKLSKNTKLYSPAGNKLLKKIPINIHRLITVWSAISAHTQLP